MEKFDLFILYVMTKIVVYLKYDNAAIILVVYMSIPPHHYFSNNILCDFPSSGKVYIRPQQLCTVTMRLKDQKGDHACRLQEVGDLVPQNWVYRQRYPFTPIQDGTLLSRMYF
jgi:hypothetical protein